MSTVLISPLAFTAASGNPMTATSPVTMAANDHPGMAWITPLANNYCFIDLGPDAALGYDWVALIGTNLRATDTIEIALCATVSGQPVYDLTYNAWSGNKPRASKADAIIKLREMRYERYMLIGLTAPGHPDGFTSVFRIVVGKGIYAPGVTYDAEMGFEDQSVITTGPGYVSVDSYPVLPTWKVPISWTSDAQWKGDIYNLLQRAGNKLGILYICDDEVPANWQTDALYGRITNKVGGKAMGFDLWSYELQLTAYLP